MSLAWVGYFLSRPAAMISKSLGVSRVCPRVVFFWCFLCFLCCECVAGSLSWVFIVCWVLYLWLVFLLSLVLFFYFMYFRSVYLLGLMPFVRLRFSFGVACFLCPNSVAFVPWIFAFDVSDAFSLIFVTFRFDCLSCICQLSCVFAFLSCVFCWVFVFELLLFFCVLAMSCVSRHLPFRVFIGKWLLGSGVFVSWLGHCYALIFSWAA